MIFFNLSIFIFSKTLSTFKLNICLLSLKFFEEKNRMTIYLRKNFVFYQLNITSHFFEYCAYEAKN